MKNCIFCKKEIAEEYITLEREGKEIYVHKKDCFQHLKVLEEAIMYANELNRIIEAHNANNFKGAKYETDFWWKDDTE
jgi:hypothetical protein